MKVKLCPDKSISWSYELRTNLWCNAKLPCGRCLSEPDNDGCAACSRIPYNYFLDCDNCKFRFICFTTKTNGEFGYEHLYGEIRRHYNDNCNAR